MEPWLQGVRGEQVKPLIQRDAPVIRVEAGPGTGKTFGLARRVVRLLHPNGLATDPRQVLIVAFNRVIAKQLREDIERELERAGYTGSQPVIKTIHALCFEVLAQHPRLLLPHERDAMIYDVMHRYPSIRTRLRNYHGVNQALRDHEAGHRPDPELGGAVRQWLVRHRAELISELPKLLLERLRAGDLDTLAYQHVIVDEFQDLTSGEQQLMARLTMNPGGSLVALGDPRQSIYSFRGNDRQGLSRLEQLTGHAVLDLPMVDCQRCPASIVAAANQLMILESATPMVPASAATPNAHVVTWNGLRAEAAGMATAIADNVDANPHDKHLIMVTRRKLGYTVRDELRRLRPQLPVNVSFAEGLLEAWAPREAYIFLSVFIDPDRAGWRSWLSYKNATDGYSFKPPERNAPAYLNLLDQTSDVITEATMRSVTDGSIVVTGIGKTRVQERSRRYLELSDRFAELQNDPDQFIEAFFSPENWQVDSRDNSTALNDLTLLKDHAIRLLNEDPIQARLLDPHTRLVKLVKQLRAEIATRETVDESEEYVQIATMWSAKGVTADHVYVLGLTDEMIPGAYRDEYPGTEADFVNEQRRLFYVTITRSKKTLVLSRPQTIQRRAAHTLGVVLPSGPGPVVSLQVSQYLRDILNFLPSGVRGADWSGCAVDITHASGAAI